MFSLWAKNKKKKTPAVSKGKKGKMTTMDLVTYLSSRYYPLHRDIRIATGSKHSYSKVQLQEPQSPLLESTCTAARVLHGITE
jgi:hypothetical protein